MRVFIDSRDLINVFNFARPVSDASIGELFRRCGHELVIPFSLISELVPDDNAPLVVARRFVKIEEDIPHVFFQQHELAAEEIASAARQYLNGETLTPFDPWRATFTDLWARGEDPIFELDVKRTLGMKKMSKQLDMMLDRAWIFHWREREKRIAVAALRQNPENMRKPAKVLFCEAADRGVKRAGVTMRLDQVDDFTALLRRRPRVAPGWRLFEEVFDQLVKDTGYKPSVNDVWDLANVMLVPYVDVATLDKAKVDLVRKATQRLRTFDPTLDWDHRVYSDLQGVLRALEC